MNLKANNSIQNLWLGISSFAILLFSIFSHTIPAIALFLITVQLFLTSLAYCDKTTYIFGFLSFLSLSVYLFSYYFYISAVVCVCSSFVCLVAFFCWDKKNIIIKKFSALTSVILYLIVSVVLACIALLPNKNVEYIYECFSSMFALVAIIFFSTKLIDGWYFALTSCLINFGFAIYYVAIGTLSLWLIFPWIILVASSFLGIKLWNNNNKKNGKQTISNLFNFRRKND